MVDKLCFASLYVPSSGNQGDLTAVERLVPKFVAKSINFKGHFMCLEKALATDSIALPVAHTSFLVLLSRKALRKLKRRAETWTQKM